MALKDRDYLLKYWVYLKRSPIALTFGFLFIPFISFFHVVQPLLIQRGIDHHIVQKDLPGLYHLVLLFGLCIFGEFIFKSLQSYIFQYIGQKTVADMRADLFWHVLNFSSGYYDKHPVGTVTTRLTSDMDSVSESFASGLVTLLGDFLTLIGITIAMYMLSPELTGVTLIIVPPLVLLVNFFRKKLRFFFNQIQSLKGKMNGFIEEQLQGIEVVQIFQREKKNFEDFKDINKDYEKATIGSLFYDSILYSMIESVNAIVIACVIWFGWAHQHHDWMTLGILVAFVDYIQKFFNPLKELSNKFATLQHALSALEKIFSLFAVKDQLDEGSQVLESIKGEIAFSHVSYAYPGHEDKGVLKDVSFQVSPGQVVAIVGPTGSGKSTITRLVSRLYSGYKGRITLDGVEITDLKLANLRRYFSYVEQDVKLFHGSVAFNITLDNPAISQENMITAAKAVQVHDFIMSLDNGYDTILDKGGQSISMGQAQLITFARALASDAPIVLLDEATASIDSLSEKLIQDAILTLFEHKTVLVIAHRLSTIQNADVIVTLKDGAILEMGNHDTLMANNGFYAHLFHMQFQEES